MLLTGSVAALFPRWDQGLFRVLLHRAGRSLGGPGVRLGAPLAFRGLKWTLAVVVVKCTNSESVSFPVEPFASFGGGEGTCIPWALA